MTGKTQVQLLKFDALQPAIDALTAATTADKNAAEAAAAAALASQGAADDSASAASRSASAAAGSVIAAQAARDKAADWADEAEDTPVETGPDRFSAAHWAARSAASASTGPTALAGLQVVIAALMTGEIGPALLLAAGEEGAIIDISEPGV